MLIKEVMDLKQLRNINFRKNVQASISSSYNKTKEYRLLTTYLTEYYFEIFSLLLSLTNDDKGLIERKLHCAKTKIKSTINSEKTGLISNLEKRLLSYFLKIKRNKNTGRNKIDIKPFNESILYDENIEKALETIGQTQTRSGMIYRLIEVYNMSIFDLSTCLDVLEPTIMIEYLQVKKAIMGYIKDTCLTEEESVQNYPYVMEDKSVYTLGNEVKKEYMKSMNKGNLVFEVK